VRAMNGPVLILGVLILALFAGLFPLYRVWSEEMRGRAELARAEQNRRIAALDAQAEVARARGVAEANQIIAEGLGGPEGYLRYLWIQQLSRNGQNVIYVPTETGLPILEAGRATASSQSR
jgi:hypothetical protein